MKFKNNLTQRLSGRHFACAEAADYLNKKIINIGCGIGFFEFLVGKTAKEIVGIDPDPVNILLAKKKLQSPTVDFVKADIMKHDLPEGACDIVTMFDVIEHLPENSESFIVKKVYNSLKPGGRFVISTPLNNFTNYFDPAWYFSKKGNRHHRHYTVEELIEPLLEEGFEIERISTGGGWYELLSMFLFYPFKWILNMEVPFKEWFDKHRKKEYLKPNGFVTLFVVARKT